MTPPHHLGLLLSNLYNKDKITPIYLLSAFQSAKEMNTKH